MQISGTVVGLENFQSKAGKNYTKMFLGSSDGGAPVEVVVDGVELKCGAVVKVDVRLSNLTLWGRLVPVTVTR